MKHKKVYVYATKNTGRIEFSMRRKGKGYWQVGYWVKRVHNGEKYFSHYIPIPWTIQPKNKWLEANCPKL